MPAITIQDLENAKTDLDHIAAIATSLAPRATDRLGHSKLTVQGASNALDQLVGQFGQERVAAAAELALMLANLTGDQLANLQSAAGAAMIGRPNGRSVANALDEIPTLAGQGGKADLTVSSQAALTSLLALAPRRPFIGPGDFLTPDLAYPTGLPLQGPGRLFKDIAGGRQQLNSYADQGDALHHVTGLEYMAAWHKAVMAQMDNPTRQLRVAQLGDSTKEGASVSPPYVPSTLFEWLMTRASMQTPAGTTVYNLGKSGWSAEQLRTGNFPGATGGPYGVPLAISLDLDLLFYSAGINEPGWNKDGNPMPADAGQDAAGRRDVADLEASLRGSLQALRTAKSVAQLAIVLEIPNATSDTPNGRDERWYEQIAPVYRRAARDFKCALIDKYALFRDSRAAAAGGWMDDIVVPGSGRAVHPLDVMNLWIAQVEFEVAYPEALRLKVGKCGIQAVAGAQDVGDASRLPEQYHYGVTIGRALLGGFPSDGNVVTIRSPDETVLQIFYPYQPGESYFIAFRHGTAVQLGGLAKGWQGDWNVIGGTSTDVMPSSPFQIGVGGAGSAERMRISSNGEFFLLEGCVSLASPVTVSYGTQIGVLPAGSMPGRSPLYNALATFYLANGNYVRNVPARILPDRRIFVDGDSGSAVSRVYITATWSRRA